LGGSARARVVHASAARFLGAPAEPFDLVFLDPPFGQGALAEYVTLIDAGGWVKAGGWVYLEAERAAGAPAVPPSWSLVKSKSAGEVGYHLARVTARDGQ
jgi:16S rRNA (guanine966-N2)-methyltransferase